MTVHFATENAGSSSAGQVCDAITKIVTAAGGTATLTPSGTYISGDITFAGVKYSLSSRNASYITGNISGAWTDDTLVIYSASETPTSTDAGFGVSYASNFIYMIITGGQLYWTPSDNLTIVFNVGAITVTPASSSARAMLTPLIEGGVDLTPVFISQNGVVDTAGTTVTDTAGSRFVSLGNLLYIREAAASEPAGTAVTCRVGAVSTLPAGSQATVTNSGTLNDVVLDFGIPQGPQGLQGLQGDAGAAGQAGAGGKAATVTVGKVTTLAAGSTATVTNSGTENAAVLDFGIPQGAAGTSGLPAGVSVTYSKDNSKLAFGDGGTTATGGAAMAVGLGATANSGNATALGQAAYAGGISGLAVGSQATTSDTQGTAVGARASASGWSTAIGSESSASTVMASDAFGCKSSATADHAVALGAASVADAEWSVSIGNSSNTRRIMHVTDPTDAQDAATKAYVDALIAKLKSDNGLK